MHFIVIGLSIIFFTLSGLVTFKALNLPAHNIAYQENWQGITSESNNIIKNLAENPNTHQVDGVDLKATIAPPESPPPAAERIIENIKTSDTENWPRTLTIFGGKTFQSGQDVIKDVAFSTIEKLVEEISAFPGSRVIIEGHTDNIPTGKQHRDNMDLSLRRAKTIANILVAHGIPLERISVMGYGDTRPIESNNTEEGKAKNRRVEVKLMMPKEREN